MPPRASAPASGSQTYRTLVPLVSTLLFFGLLWAYSRIGRERRSERQQVVREQVQVAPARGPRISNDEIVELIEQCSYFQERIVVKIPRSVYPGMMSWVDKRVIVALNMQLIELDPPFNAAEAARYLPNPAYPGPPSEFRRGRNPQGIPLFETAQGYELDVGLRKIEKIEFVQRVGDHLSVGYRWTVEDPRLLPFAPDSSELQGGAEVQHSSSGWKVRAWRNTSRGALMLCEQ